MTAKTTRQTGPCQDFEHDAGKVPPTVPVPLITCPCCGSVVFPFMLKDAPSVTRGPIAMALSKEGLTPAQISQVTGWKRTTVRSLLWYQRNVAKEQKP